MTMCVCGSVVSAGVNAGWRVSVGSLVKIQLNEPAGSGLVLRVERDGCLRASSVC